ncbi:MAG: DUF4238 domain-containing protein [Nitrospinae bacterium]|nr:DUF4238 domain-containing protein [Nitrospinota bacterium]
MKQHTVPKFILKRFVDDEGYLHVFNKSEDRHGIRKQTPKSTFREKHLYTSQDLSGKKDYGTEKMFGQLEHSAAPVIEKLISAINSGKLPGLSSAEKEVIDEFICAQLKRTAETLESLDPQKAMDDQIKKVADEDGISVSTLLSRYPEGVVEWGVKILIPEMLRVPSLKLIVQ